MLLYSVQNPSLQSIRGYYVYVCLAVFMAHVHIVKPRYFESYHVFFIVIISWGGVRLVVGQYVVCCTSPGP